MPSLVDVTLAPTCASTSSADCSSSGRAPSQQHVAAGHRHRHRIGAGLDPVGQHGVARAVPSRDTPSISMREVPAPVIFAPILIRQSATSLTSGSRAAFSITVVPLRERRPPSARHACRRPSPSETRSRRRAAALRRARHHIAAVDLDRGAEPLHRHDQQIDRPRADGAAARQRHLALRPCAPAAARSPRSSRASWRRGHRARWCRRYCAAEIFTVWPAMLARRPARLPDSITSTP